MLTNNQHSLAYLQTADPSSAKTVLHVLDHSWPILSGYSVRSRNLISAQYRSGQSIIVVTSPLHYVDDPDAVDMDVDGVRYLRAPITGLITKAALQNRWPILREYEVVRMLRKRILELLSTQSISVVYAHSPALCGLAALQAARKRGVPFVYEIRGFWEDAAVDQNRINAKSVRYRLTRNLETYIAQRADAVAVIANNMLEDMYARGVPREKLFHVPNGVDMGHFSPIRRDERLATQLNLGNGPTLGYFGSLYRYEGVSWMIRAAANLRSRGHRFNILIVGRGEDNPAITNAVRDCGASDYVRRIEHVPYEQIARYYSVIDVFVCPRRSVRLTELVTPLKPLEAMASEKPVLASAVGGIRELVQHEHTGLLFQAESPSDFCYQAERLISSPELCKSLAKEGREFVKRERDWNVLAKRYTQIYDFVLKGQQFRMS